MGEGHGEDGNDRGLTGGHAAAKASVDSESVRSYEYIGLKDLENLEGRLIRLE